MAGWTKTTGRWARLALAAAVLLAGVPALAACTVITGQACASWADFSDPAAAYRQASVVLIGTVEGRDGELGTEFGKARAYRVDVERVVKGEVDGATVRMAALPDSCGPSGGYYKGVDQLKGADRVLIYAQTVHGALAPLTPGQGVVAFPEGTALPDWTHPRSATPSPNPVPTPSPR